MPHEPSLHLKVLIPSRIFLDIDVDQIVMDTTAGSYGILPRRLDFAAILEPGILTYQKQSDAIHYLVHDIGVVVKTGREVLISTHKALEGVDLGKMKEHLKHQTEEMEESESHLREIMAELETDIASHLLGI